MKTILVSFLILSYCITFSQTTCTFDGGGDGSSWSDAGNWTCNSEPDLSSDTVIIPMGFDVINDNSDDFSIENASRLIIAGSLDMDAKKIELKSKDAYLEVSAGGNLFNVGEFIMNSNSTAFFELNADFECEFLKIDDGCSLIVDARCISVTDKLENLSDGGVYGTGCIDYTGDPSDYVNDGSGGMFGCDEPDLADCPLDGGSGLPVTLFNFEATYIGNNVRVGWTTLSEINNDYFLLEKCDGNAKWSALARIDGNGNSNSTLEYSFLDSRPFKDITYYRLTQFDYDGTKEVFKPIAVRANSHKSFVYPNPTTKYLNVKLEEPLDAFSILSSTMEDCTSRVGIIEYSEQLIVLDLSNLRSGFYFIRLNERTHSFIKQ